MAPESLENGIYTYMTDMWSYGVILYEIITFGNFPFQVKIQFFIFYVKAYELIRLFVIMF